MNKFTLIDKAFFLKRTLLFGKLDLDLLLAIADKLQVVVLEADQVVFGVGEEAFRMYFIVKGKVEVSNQEGAILAHLTNDDFFGDESIFSERTRGYHAVCKSETTLLALSRTNLLTIISECPSVALGILHAYTAITTFRPRKQS